MASSSSAVAVTRDEFNAFHKCDRALFRRFVVRLRRDINQSLQVMSFLLYLEKSGLVSNLIVNFNSLPDFFINTVADEVVMCLSCLSYENFSMFVANFGKKIIPLITRMTGEYLTLAVIHQNRESILLDMKKHLTSICYPAFEDICVQAEKEKVIEDMKHLGFSKAVHKAGSSSQFLSEQQATTRTSKVGVFSEDEQAREDDRTVFLTFSRGYPLSEAEVHAYFTRYY